MSRNKVDSKTLVYMKKFAIYPGYATTEKRLSTFTDWPIGYFLPPEIVAEAGFFSCKKSDEVTCWMCAGKIKDIVPFADIFSIHTNSFAECRYINFVVGHDYVKKNRITTNDSLKCKVCLLNNIDTLVLPCKHVCLCGYCARQLVKCPVCRTQILKEDKIFLT